MDKIPQIKPENGPDERGGEGVGQKEHARGTGGIKRILRKRTAAKVFAGLFLFFLIFAFFVLIPALSLLAKSKTLMREARELEAAFRAQDINLVKTELDELGREFGSFENSYGRFSWTNPLPFVGGYWRDGRAGLSAGRHALEAAEITVETLEPYADLIGFSGAQAAGGETANDRVEFLARTIEQVLPNIDPIAEKVRLADAEVQKIDASRYPARFRGKEIRSRISQVQDISRSGAELLTNGKPLLEASPYLLGIDAPRNYLVLFQNDKELRPTGGFLTAYSVAEVSSGKFNPTRTDDIYNLDGRYKAVEPAPEPILRFIKEPYSRFPGLRLRDMNWSPDFARSMELFSDEAKSVGVDGIDGIIAVDTHVAVNLLRAIGQIGVPGYGNFNAETDSRCDCPQVVYELEAFADIEGAIVWSENEPGKIVFAPPNYENRKKIVGPLMNSMLANALGQPKEKLPSLFQAVWESLTEKHVLVYVFDEDVQRGVEAFGIGGNIRDFEGDYLHVNDANLGGRKSNLYVTHSVSQEIEVANDGTVVKTLTLTYSNPKPQDGWLNSVLPNWTRIYVPEGSELLESEGFDDEVEVGHELGKTVFAGGFELRPMGVKKITVKYRLPLKIEGDYRLLVQKQPGKDSPLYSVKINGKTDEFFLKTDKELKFSL